ncbi:unnamed protein product, partial [Closterium sp. Naga37s-1]
IPTIPPHSTHPGFQHPFLLPALSLHSGVSAPLSPRPLTPLTLGGTGPHHCPSLN